MEQKFKLGDVVRVKDSGRTFEINNIERMNNMIFYSEHKLDRVYNESDLELAPIKKELSREDVLRAWDKVNRPHEFIHVHELIKELGL